MAVFDNGVVVNVNDAPPFDEEGVMELELVDDTLKSEAKPVVAPAAPDMKTVHEIEDETRCGEPKLHVNDDNAVGIPYTT